MAAARRNGKVSRPWPGDAETPDRFRIIESGNYKNRIGRTYVKAASTALADMTRVATP